MGTATSAIEAWLHEPAALVIGWALLHFVWQGAMIGVLAATALAALRSSAADVRYVVATIALSLMLTLPVVTATQMWAGGRPAPSPPVEVAGACAAAPPSCLGAAGAQVGTGADTTPRPMAAIGNAVPPGVLPFFTFSSVELDQWLPALVLGWLCGVALLTLRLMSGWLWVQRMKSHGAVAAREGWQHIAARLARSLHISRSIRLLESTLVEVPTVIGWIKPVVLLPASALAGLTPRQLEAILAHELAHIRRHDYLVNLVQTLVETMLFYHPAVWWLSRRIRIERENCCDDLAVSLCGDPYAYATALADLEELRGATGQLVVAASGGSLLQRVRRLLGAPTHAGRAPGWLAAGAMVAAMLGIGAGATGTQRLQQPPAASTPVIAEAPAEAQPGNRPVAATPVLAEARIPRSEEAPQQPEVLADRAANTAAVAELRASTPAVSTAIEPQAHSVALQARTIQTGAHDLASASSLAMSVASTAARPVLAGTAQSHTSLTWSNNGERIEVRYDGEVEFSDDDTDVKRLTPGGSLRIKEGGVFGGFFASHTIEFTTDASGAITRRFWDGTSERPFDPEGRLWLANHLPRFVRQSGFGARARVARILKAKGAAGVLAEIALIEGSWAKKTYFLELLRGPLDAPTVRQVLMQAGREIDSDFELASLLIDHADKLLVDEGSRQAYFDAARSIGSDFEMHRVYDAALKRGPLAPPVLAGVLNGSRNIESDSEEAGLLERIAKLQPLDDTTRGPFFEALATVASDFEHRRVLSALAERADLTPQTITAMLISATSVESDSEAASFLTEIAKRPIEGTVREPFFRAVDSLGSAFERARVLQAVVARRDASADTILQVLQAAAAMNNSFERAQVLLAVAAGRPLAGPARDAYIDASAKLGDYEQGRVLAALVRNEKR